MKVLFLPPTKRQRSTDHHQPPTKLRRKGRRKAHSLHRLSWGLVPFHSQTVRPIPPRGSPLGLASFRVMASKQMWILIEFFAHFLPARSELQLVTSHGGGADDRTWPWKLWPDKWFSCSAGVHFPRKCFPSWGCGAEIKLVVGSLDFCADIITFQLWFWLSLGGIITELLFVRTQIESRPSFEIPVSKPLWSNLLNFPDLFVLSFVFVFCRRTAAGQRKKLENF